MIANTEPTPFCKLCGRPTLARSRQFCSRQCARSYHSDIAAGRLVWSCKHCGVPITPRPGEKPSRVFRRQFCSEECRKAGKPIRLVPPPRQRAQGLSVDSAGVSADGLAIAVRIVVIDAHGKIAEEQLLEITLDYLVKQQLLPSKRRGPFKPWQFDDDE